jgi:hypothetical protein
MRVRVAGWLSAAILVLSSVLVCAQAMAQNASSKPTRDINAVLADHDKELLAIPDVVGVYVGTSQDQRTPCLKVMLARTNAESQRKIPRVIEGYSVITEVSGDIRALDRRPRD